MNFIVYDPFTSNHHIFYDTISFYLKNFFSVSFVSTVSTLSNNMNDIVMLMIDPHFLYSYDKSTDTYRMSLYSSLKKIKYKIIYLTEPIDYLIDKKVYIDMIRHIQPYCIWTYSYHSHDVFPSYHSFVLYPSVFSVPKPLNVPRRNDKIVFIGKVNPYRQEILNTFGDSVLVIDNQYGDELVSYYTTFSFFLNIHRRKKTESLETFRICPILYYGGTVLSQDVCTKDKKEFENASIYYEDSNTTLFSLFQMKKMLENHEYTSFSFEENHKHFHTFLEWTLSVIPLKSSCDNEGVAYAT